MVIRNDRAMIERALDDERLLIKIGKRFRLARRASKTSAFKEDWTIRVHVGEHRDRTYILCSDPTYSREWIILDER
jgi:hypothetical protein